MGLRERISLYNRYPDNRIGKTPTFKTFYLIMEGTKTEPTYFQHLEKKLIELRVRNNIRLVYLERTARDRGSNTPTQLYNFLQTYKAQKNDPNAVYAMVFDRDSYKNRPDPERTYLGFLNKVKKKEVRLLVTSPCFELWLLLHKKDSYQKYIVPKVQEIFMNERLSTGYTYLSKMVKDIFGFNPKSTIPLDLLDGLDEALKQSYYLTSKPEKMARELGENISDFIRELRMDYRP